MPELINMLVQLETTIKRLKPAVMLGEASTSKKGKKARRWKKKKKNNAKGPAPASKPIVKALTVGKRKRKDVPKTSKEKDACTTAMRKGIGRGIVLNSLPMSKVFLLLKLK
ncbi:UNVERIFIED_CONTAM: hypothetical protein Sradi_6155900 [Sesamum radiatum]|uniref:Uncharacterized protein n=1 Tax=Sesamum radiatum TaxID=300843 RepID=A0AAW2K935_SESRA